MKKILILFSFLMLLQLVLAQESISSISKNTLTNLPLPLLGIVLGLLDGIFNPCALSVLFFLIAYLLGLGSRKKCLIIGVVYSLMIFLVYFSFMYGILKLIYFLGYLELIKNLVGLVLIIFGLIEAKDFLFYGRGISLKIPEFASPTIEKLVKAATLPSAILLGFFVSLVEIPCAGAFPLFYTTFIAAKNIEGVKAVFYILWYNLFFVLPLILITLLFYFGLAKVEETEEKRIKLRKYMRLIAGIVMISLGSLMLMRLI